MFRTIKHIIKEYKYIRIRNQVEDLFKRHGCTPDSVLRTYLSKMRIDEDLESRVLASLLSDGTVCRDHDVNVWIVKGIICVEG